MHPQAQQRESPRRSVARKESHLPAAWRKAKRHPGAARQTENHRLAVQKETHRPSAVARQTESHPLAMRRAIHRPSAAVRQMESHRLAERRAIHRPSAAVRQTESHRLAKRRATHHPSAAVRQTANLHLAEVALRKAILRTAFQKVNHQPTVAAFQMETRALLERSQDRMVAQARPSLPPQPAQDRLLARRSLRAET